jgi:hypothetical protein
MKKNDYSGLAEIVVGHVCHSAEIAKASRAKDGVTVKAIPLNRSQAMAMFVPLTEGEKEAALALKFIQAGYNCDAAIDMADAWIDCGVPS